jgi:hypothetical protein
VAQTVSQCAIELVKGGIILKTDEPRGAAALFGAEAAGAVGSREALTQRARAGGDHKLIRSDHRSKSLRSFMDPSATPATPAVEPAVLTGTRPVSCSIELMNAK